MFRCIGEDETFAAVDDHISSGNYTFQFDAFQFKNSGTSNVFLTCQMYVCKPEDAGLGLCVQPVRLHTYTR